MQQPDRIPARPPATAAPDGALAAIIIEVYERLHLRFGDIEPATVLVVIEDCVALLKGLELDRPGAVELLETLAATDLMYRA